MPRLTKLNQFFGVQISKVYFNRPSGVVGVYGKGNLGVSFLRGSICAEGMGCGKGWAVWVLQGTGTDIGRPGVS